MPKIVTMNPKVHEDMLDMLYTLLPFMEDVADFDTAYKKGHVQKVVNKLKQVIEAAEAEVTCTNS